MPRKKVGTQKKMEWKFSIKQLFAMYWWNIPRCAAADGFIAHGSIRSGKTVAMSLGFVQWAQENYDGRNFILSGKTIMSFQRNVLSPLQSYMPYIGYTMHERKSENKIVVTSPNGHVNDYYIFGGNDASSQDLVQGLTAAGAYLDEVVLMPESFVQQTIARCSVAGAKIWMNCNPEGETHYIKTDYIDRNAEKNYIVCHFTMDDNMSLTKDRKDFYARQYQSGIFRRRFVLGEWCLADGLVYTSYNPEKMDIDGDTDYDDYSELILGYDYGIQNPTAFVLLGYNVKAGCIDVLDSWGYSGRDTEKQKTDDELYQDLESFVGARLVLYCYGDPSATSFHAVVKKRGVLRDREADNSVNEGINFTSMLFNLGQLRIHKRCIGLKKELTTYSWDSEKSRKEGKDIVLKQNDHYCDALRYALYTYYYRKAKSYGLGDYS